MYLEVASLHVLFHSGKDPCRSYLVLNSNIKDSLKKFSILFRQVEMVFVIVWFLDHFTLEYVPSMNTIWIITFVSLLNVWVTKFKTSLKFFKLSILTSNNVICVGLTTVLFDEAQHVVKTSLMGYVPVFYEVINLFIKPQYFLLMLLICKFKGLYLNVTVENCCIFFFDELLMFFLYFVCKLLSNMRKEHTTTVSTEVFDFDC